jgi:hypothetical protein
MPTTTANVTITAVSDDQNALLSVETVALIRAPNI